MDPQSLSVQYATSANLAARIELHQRFSTNAYGLQRWIFDRLQLAPGMRVLEVACGTGSLWRENLERMPGDVELVLSDFSLGMVQTTRRVLPRASFVACALPELPFADGAFDLAIANHMLYHVDQRQRGLADIRRVLRDGGALFASTNGVEHLRELKTLMREFDIDGGDISASFTLENAEEQLRGAFDVIERDEYVDGLRVTDAELVLRYIASMNASAAEIVAKRADKMRAIVAERIERDGAFYVMKSTGSFIARNA
jgi:ubiquinone/menaquinone biosynthesis C-methylase UbiE